MYIPTCWARDLLCGTAVVAAGMRAWCALHAVLQVLMFVVCCPSHVHTFARYSSYRRIIPRIAYRTSSTFSKRHKSRRTKSQHPPSPPYMAGVIGTWSTVRRREVLQAQARSLEVYHPIHDHCRVVALRYLPTRCRSGAGTYASGSCVGVEKKKPPG